LQLSAVSTLPTPFLFSTICNSSDIASFDYSGNSFSISVQTAIIVNIADTFVAASSTGDIALASSAGASSTPSQNSHVPDCTSNQGVAIILSNSPMPEVS
jgi:hypothetical protein